MNWKTLLYVVLVALAAVQEETSEDQSGKKAISITYCHRNSLDLQYETNINFKVFWSLSLHCMIKSAQ